LVENKILIISYLLVINICQ